MKVFNIYAVSDATGKTAEGVLRAAMTQFDAPGVQVTRFGDIRTAPQIRELVTQAAKNKALIVHTLVQEDQRRLMLHEGRAANVITVDIMGPMLAHLSDLLSAKPRAEPGLFEPFDATYLARIEAIDYTVRHDDGRNLHDIDRAEIVLVGVSRTSKTPLSIYLGYRGWRVANVPLALTMQPPETLFRLPKRRVVGLVIKPERLVELRQVRSNQMGVRYLGYADLDTVRKEMAFAYEVFERRRDWPLVDVTAKPIEEAAAEVVMLLGQSIDKPGVGL